VKNQLNIKFEVEVTLLTSYGNNIKINIFGGSHDSEIGVVVQNLPAGLKIDFDSLKVFMARRAPGQSALTTSRKEADLPIFESGVDESLTTNGDVFRAVIKNTNQRSADYSNLTSIPRPSHADYPAIIKSSGTVDLRGGGHFSGRLTAPMCIIGGILKNELEKHGIYIGAHIESVGAVHDKRFDPINVSRTDFESILSHTLPVLDESTADDMSECIKSAHAALDSIGGVIECAAIGLPVGIGEHMFAGMESRISSIVFSIPAIKGIEFGAGFASSAMYGSENNDPYYTNGERVITKTNNCGGILGGMTNGMPLIFRAAVKPTPSIGIEQDSVDLRSMKNTKVTVGGRHDPCIVPRAVPVFEAACAIAIYDALLDAPSKNLSEI